MHIPGPETTYSTVLYCIYCTVLVPYSTVLYGIYSTVLYGIYCTVLVPYSTVLYGIYCTVKTNSVPPCIILQIRSFLNIKTLPPFVIHFYMILEDCR